MNDDVISPRELAGDCPRRLVCPACRGEMIHRDHRRITESSTGIGDLIGRAGPQKGSGADFDYIWFKRLPDGRVLLYIIEQKQSTHSLWWPQEEILGLLAECLAHCSGCPRAAGLCLDPRSSVLLMSGDIDANPATGHARFVGPQRLCRVRLVGDTLADGAHEKLKRYGEPRILMTPEELFRLLDPVDLRRRNGHGRQNG